MKKINTIILLPLLLLTSCTKSKEISFICPKGAPAIAFYDQGNNANVEIISDSVQILAELQNDKYDVVLIDSIMGLNSIKNKKTNYKLKKLITGGNIFLAGIGTQEIPNDGSTILSFQKSQNSVVNIVLNKLIQEKWKINPQIIYANNITEAQVSLATGYLDEKKIDYVYMAEPALSLTKKTQNLNNVNIIKNITSEWENLTGEQYIPQAGLFINQNCLNEKSDLLNQELALIQNRLNDVLKNPEKVINALDEFGTKEQQASRFGFNTLGFSLVNTVNGFGVINSEIDTKQIINNFILKTQNGQIYEDKYFC